MKVFVSYAFTGEDEMALTKRLDNIRKIFERLKLKYYINIYDPDYQGMVDNNATPDEYLTAAFKELKTSSTVLVINTSDRSSEGVLMEIGAAKMLGLEIILAQHQSSVGKTYTPTVANESFIWQTESELLEKIEEIFNGQN